MAFPTPWPDEAHFLWQAHAFAQDLSLFSTHLNTDRIILWMPPAYMVVVGAYFKVVGSSLEAGRLLSLLFMVPALWLLLRFVASFGSRWWALLFWGLFIVNARFIACGNIARMEALLLLMVSGAFLLLQRGHLTWGVLLLLFTPLVHFNGALFLTFGIAYAFYRFRIYKDVFSWNRWALALSVFHVLSWIGYAALATTNWESFMLDMGFQFQRKGNNDIFAISDDKRKSAPLDTHACRMCVCDSSRPGFSSVAFSGLAGLADMENRSRTVV